MKAGNSWQRLLTTVKILRAVRADPRTPWYCRWLLYLAIAYAVSPIDLIPDFIPVLGHLDDLVIVPLLAGAAWFLLPAAVRAEHRARATAKPADAIADDAEQRSAQP